MNYFSIDGTGYDFFVVFHGTGGNEYSLIQFVGDIDPTASILAFEGDVGVGAARRFFQPLKNGQIDRTDFDARVDAFLTRWGEIKPDNKRLTFLGFSNGANFILGLLEKNPTIAERIVLLHPTNLNFNFNQGSDSEIFITTGAVDTISIPGDTMRLVKQLEAHFPHATMKLLDGGHQITEQEITFLQKQL